MITLREPDRDDAPSLARIQAQSLREQGAGFYDEGQLEHLAPSDYGPERISDGVFEGDDRYAILAEIDAEIVGFAVVHTENGYLSGIFVDPDHFGQGIGTTLLKNIEEYVREIGLKELETHAALNAIEFYEKCGLDQHEKIDVGPPDGPEVRAIKMRKSLD